MLICLREKYLLAGSQTNNAQTAAAHVVGHISF
jgi:hypothetical protein